MSDAVPYADILILALIAGFILLRLRGVLGKTDGEKPDMFKRALPPKPERDERDDEILPPEEKPSKTVRPPEVDTYLAALPSGPIADTLQAIKAKDPQFTATRFLSGAKGAFEMVFDAFARGDKATLKMLMSDPIYQHFSQDIDERKSQENVTEVTLLSVNAKDITQASLTGSVARLTVQFLSEQVSLVRNSKGDIVEGDPSDIDHGEDQWTFERDILSKNPNWKIIET